MVYNSQSLIYLHEDRAVLCRSGRRIRPVEVINNYSVRPRVLFLSGSNQCKSGKRGDICKPPPAMIALRRIKWFDIDFGFGDFKTEP